MDVSAPPTEMSEESSHSHLTLVTWAECAYHSHQLRTRTGHETSLPGSGLRYYIQTNHVLLELGGGSWHRVREQLDKTKVISSRQQLQTLTEISKVVMGYIMR